MNHVCLEYSNTNPNVTPTPTPTDFDLSVTQASDPDVTLMPVVTHQQQQDITLMLMSVDDEITFDLGVREKKDRVNRVNRVIVMVLSKTGKKVSKRHCITTLEHQSSS